MDRRSAEEIDYVPPPAAPEPERSTNQDRSDELADGGVTADSPVDDAQSAAGLQEARFELDDPASPSNASAQELSPGENFERMPDILARPDVAQATGDLLRASQLNDPEKHHIEGAFIVEDAQTGAIRLERVTPAGTADQITWPESGPALGGAERLVGLYHTQPTSETGVFQDQPVPTPTDRDEIKADYFGVPGVVANERGFWVY